MKLPNRPEYSNEQCIEKFNIKLYDILKADGVVKPASRTLPAVPAEALDPTNILDRFDAAQRQRRRRLERLAKSAEAMGLFGHIPPLGGQLSRENPFPPISPDRRSVLKQIIAAAYRDIRASCSTDLLIVDPCLNAEFHRRCYELGAQASPEELNWLLLDGRKAGDFSELKRSRAYSIPPDVLDKFSFASEIALRFMHHSSYERFGGDLSLDRILCTPDLTALFDELASRIAPGYSKLEYRWAALSLRKIGKRTRPVPNIELEDFEDFGLTRALNVDRVPKCSGLYLFTCDSQPVYAGQTSSLRDQIETHFSQWDVRVIPSWIDNSSYSNMKLHIAPFTAMPASSRNAIKLARVKELRPRFNWLPEAA